MTDRSSRKPTWAHWLTTTSVQNVKSVHRGPRELPAGRHVLCCSDCPGCGLPQAPLKGWAGGETWGKPSSGQLMSDAAKHQDCENSASSQAEGQTPILCVCWMSGLSKWTPSPTLPLSATPIPSPVSERPSLSGPISPLPFPYTSHLQSQLLLA